MKTRIATLFALCLLIGLSSTVGAATAVEPVECSATTETDWTVAEVLDLYGHAGLEAEPVAGGGGHPVCPLPRDCFCITGACGPLAFPPQCSQDDLGDNVCSVGNHKIRVCPKGQTIRVTTCLCEDFVPCNCGNRVTVSCS